METLSFAPSGFGLPSARYLKKRDALKITSVMSSIVICFFLLDACVLAAVNVDEEIAALEQVVGEYPPQINSEGELKAIESRYLKVKEQLNTALAQDPKNIALLLKRGHLQAMGHNLDYHPGAWEAAESDLKQFLRYEPNHVEALLELGMPYVNSHPSFAPKAQGLFLSAQEAHGKEPLEPAQRGLFFALYYQGKMHEAHAQAMHLVNTWPSVDGYKNLLSITDEVLNRASQQGK